MELFASAEMSADVLLILLAETYVPFAAVAEFPEVCESFAPWASSSRDSSESLPAKTVVQHPEKRDTQRGTQSFRF